MADVQTDVCKSCSSKFSDLKSVLKCAVCENYFHASCEKVTETRGLHTKRASWKCSSCVSAAVSTDPKNRKRVKADCGDVIEVDRVMFENLVDLVKKLTSSVNQMKSQLSAIVEKDKKLSRSARSSVGEKPKSDGFSFASIAGQSTVARSNVNNSQKNLSTVQKASPFVFGSANAKTDDDSSPPATVAHLHGDSALGSRSATGSGETVPDGFQLVKRRTRRISKPLIIGSSDPTDTTSADVAGPNFSGTERRQWIYVGRVKPGTTADTVSNYVKSKWNIEDIKCVQLVQKEDFCSFKVGVSESRVKSLLDASKWPKLVAVREFVHFPRFKPTINSPHAKENFHQTSPTQDQT